MCQRLVRSAAIDELDVTVIGDEPTPAYDRVRLSSLMDGVTLDELTLADADWYRHHGIELITGRRVVRILRGDRVAVDDTGHAWAYDELVLATGSHAFVPPIPGLRSDAGAPNHGMFVPGVFVYRTADDLRCIRSHCSRRDVRRGAVIGGGLLGLEAAKVLRDAGLEVDVIEMAPGLMPRQLDAEAASRLRDHVESLGVGVHVVRRTRRVETTDNGLRIHFDNADPMDTDVLIVAAGVRPNDELAAECRLTIGPRRGVAVDATLTTDDPRIHAVGECASVDGHVAGLIAPCLRMADVLADRLAGGDQTYDGVDESAELKLLGVQVATVGRVLDDSPGGRVLTHRGDDGYRKLLIERGRIVGASCVGPWDELPAVRQSIARGDRLRPWHRRRFVRSGSPWVGGADAVADWPSAAIICSCNAIPKSVVAAVVDDGCRTPSDVAAACGAGGSCGGCHALIAELVGGPPTKAAVPEFIVPGAAAMTAASVVGLVLAIAWTLSPPVPIADSVTSAWRNVDVLWRDDVARQATGFTLLAITAAGMLFSLRKHLPKFSWGSYGSWRAVHGITGTLTLIALAVHTGMRLGVNLNLALGVCFLAVATLGGVAGLMTGIENRLTGAAAVTVRRVRPLLSRVHLYAAWPLPALIAWHVASFYWFND